MNSKEDVLNLVQALTQSERRYFKRFTSRHVLGGKSAQQELFDLAISSSNHDQLDKKVRKASRHKGLAEAKYQLQEQVLRALDSYYYGEGIEQRIRREVHHVEVLIKKNLLKLARKRMVRAKKKAADYELSDLVLKFNDLERWIVLRTETHDEISSFLDKTQKENEDFEEMARANRHLKILGDKLYLFHVKNGVVRTDDQLNWLEDLMGDDLLQDVISAPGIRAKQRYYYSWRTYAFLIQDEKEYLKYARLYREHMEEHAFLIELFPNLYMSALESEMQAIKDAYEFDLYPAVHTKYLNIATTYKWTNTNFIKQQSTIEGYRIHLDFLSLTGQFEAGREYVESYQNDHNLEDWNINSATRILILFEEAKVFFGSGAFEDCLLTLNKLLQTPEGEREDIKGIIRVMRLLVHFELSNYEVLPYEIRSTYRFLLRRKRYYKIEEVLIRFFKELSNLPPGKARLIESFRNLKEKIYQWKDDNLESMPLYYFDFASWLESKITQKSFAEIVKWRAENRLEWP